MPRLLAGVTKDRPIEITQPGIYEVVRPITWSRPDGAAVLVSADDVTLYLRADITGFAGPAARAAAVEAVGARNLSIIGDSGRLSGFRWGVRLTQCPDARISNVTIAQSWFCGIGVDGHRVVIEGCDVREVHGSSFQTPSRCRGIHVHGSEPRIMANTVTNVAASGQEETLGISVDDLGQGGLVSRNVIANDAVVERHQRTSFGIWIGGCSQVVVAENAISRYQVGIAIGRYASGFVRGNAFQAVAEPVSDRSALAA